MADIEAKQYDTSGTIAHTLSNADGTAINLTGATVRFRMWAEGGIGGTPAIDAAATIVSAANGQVSYTWASGDTDTAGRYWADWKITFGDSTTKRVPTAGHISALITPAVT